MTYYFYCNWVFFIWWGICMGIYFSLGLKDSGKGGKACHFPISYEIWGTFFNFKCGSKNLALCQRKTIFNKFMTSFPTPILSYLNQKQSHQIFPRKVRRSNIFPQLIKKQKHLPSIPPQYFSWNEGKKTKSYFTQN